VVVNILAAMQR